MPRRAAIPAQIRKSAAAASPIPGSAKFSVDCPVVAFEKAGAPDGQQRRIAGIISTDALDQQNERLIQSGLKFDKFLSAGWLNYDHRNESVSDIVGYPSSVAQFNRGDTLPNGQKSEHNCSWVEGYLIGKHGKEIWNLAKDLSGTPRALGFSVEGTINKRDGADRNVIVSADVSAVAVTGAPINQFTRLEVLARSMSAIKNRANKAFTYGSPAAPTGTGRPGPAPNVPATGTGAGQVTSNSFAAKPKKREKQKHDRNAPLSKNSAIAWVMKRVPNASRSLAIQFVKTARRLKRRGLI